MLIVNIAKKELFFASRQYILGITIVIYVPEITTSLLNSNDTYLRYSCLIVYIVLLAFFSLGCHTKAFFPVQNDDKIV